MLESENCSRYSGTILKIGLVEVVVSGSGNSKHLLLKFVLKARIVVQGFDNARKYKLNKMLSKVAFSREGSTKPRPVPKSSLLPKE